MFSPALEPELAAQLQHDAYRRGITVIEVGEAQVARAFGQYIALAAPMREVDLEHIGPPPERTVLRLRMSLADRVIDEAGARDISYSAYLAHLLRCAYGRPSDVPEPVRPVPYQQELVMGA